MHDSAVWFTVQSLMKTHSHLTLRCAAHHGVWLHGRCTPHNYVESVTKALTDFMLSWCEIFFLKWKLCCMPSNDINILYTIPRIYDLCAYTTGKNCEY